MIKNLIFDLDNTLIRDEKVDAEIYKDALRNCGYSEENYMKIFDEIDNYDDSITEDIFYYDRKDMLDFINNALNENYDLKLIDEIIRLTGEHWIQRTLVKEDVMKKLAEKYDMYVFTNYFQEAQDMRIKNTYYSKYIKKTFGSDIYGCKQFKKAFENVLSELNADVSECIMIGDNKLRDIVAANNVGMKSVLYDYNGNRDLPEYKLNNYVVLTDLNELIDIL